MSLCPHCNKELKLKAPQAYDNVFHYGGTVTSVTECCDKAVTVTRVVSYHVDKYRGSDIEDSWGNKIKRSRVGGNDD